MQTSHSCFALGYNAQLMAVRGTTFTERLQRDVSPALQSFAAVIQRYMTMDQASKDGRQALLAMASKPCMREVRRQPLPADRAQLLPGCFSGALHQDMAQWLWPSLLHSEQLPPS